MVKPPALLYGTAWKEERTESLVRLALATGFRGFDTANQRKHYVEAAVGAALREHPRDELFLQTKFTFLPGQDQRLPYDPKAPVALQVEQSFASSLDHLHTTYLDAYVLHGPMAQHGLSPEDIAAWHAMEALHAAGKVRLLGISNVSLDQFERLMAVARVKPAIVQNRCYARRGWDRAIREFCRQRSIIYQGFSLLTANRAELQRPAVDSTSQSRGKSANLGSGGTIDAIMARTGATREQVVFRFALHVGILPLTGTSSEQHMREDLAVTGFALTEDEIRSIEHIAG